MRSQLRRAITFRLTAGVGQLDVVLLDPLLEDTVRRAITRTPAGAFLTLAPQAARDVIAAIRARGRRAPSPRPSGRAGRSSSRSPTSAASCASSIERELPDVWVVSFAELLPEVALKPVARATAAEKPSQG